MIGDPNGINTSTGVVFTSVRSIGGHSYTIEGGGNAAFHYNGQTSEPSMLQ